jgi:glutamate synthase (NADPH/NADH) large chain
VVIAALLGGEEFGMATASLVATGCVLLRKCHLNTCSVGIATQDPALRARYAGRPEHVVNYFTMVAEGVRRLMGRLGIRRFDDLVGRVDLLRPRGADGPAPVAHWKARHVDLSAVVAQPPEPIAFGAVTGPARRRFVAAQPWSLDDHLDHEILRRAEDALAAGRPATVELAVENRHRAVGTYLSGELTRRHGARGLPDDTLQVRLTGSAGQSFGAFLAPGVTLQLAGEANDYLGKGLSGGRIAVTVPPGARFAPEDNVLIGNVALYGATGGELYAAGLAGERFAVRNSGARAVVEGVGDHGCEYMTGGVVLVLGPTGRNFGAGMSGGTAYVFDRDQAFRGRCNLEMVELEPLADESDLWLVQQLLEDHVRWTGSPLGRRLADTWRLMVPRFVKVMPVDYKRALQQRRAQPRPRPSAALQVVEGGR